ncbi:DNA processing protein DprA [Microbacterium barkeri]|uniref:DNA processing protein DprA n=1 Tax=Microbacterium barkeri TaxID=33917 RepID=A0A9W6H0H6_9MICO|nr:DNA-processing protein DprA [Microbacterium barkeri]MDR6875887.1 DNA processing protein [Microbacterium barkeri]GLJ60005.1 DNA processing protein DprA [Microbacterium barkeri]
MTLLDDDRVRRAGAAHSREEPARLARAVWTAIVEPGDGTAGALVAAHGPDEALRMVEAGLHDGSLAELGLGAQALAAARSRWQPRLDPAHVAQALAQGARAGLVLVTPEDAGWPEQLTDLGTHAPLALWTRGDVTGLSRIARSVAIVGARAATPYGEHVAAELAGELASRGIGVISGAAYGIDGAAHRATLGVGGLTVAVVAGGADRVYPAGHARLFADIARVGAIVSETAPGATPTKWRFLQRNRCIAALSAATVVVEAGARSGTLNTAGHAAALGRPLGAVPGPVTSATSAGCHRLLREFDAQCITSAADVLELIGEGADDATALGGPSAEEVRVRDALASRSPRDVDEIARRSGMAVEAVQAALGLLELAGAVRRTDGGWVLA